MTASERRETVQEALESGEFASTAFGSPEHGAVVELLMCEHLGLTHEDGEYIDAFGSDGTPIQIKACQREHSNGGGETVPGRWDLWSDGLIHLVADEGLYLLVVYNGDMAPEDASLDAIHDYILDYVFVEAADVGALTDELEWHDGGRPSKGQRARLGWPHVFDEVPEP